MEIAEELKRKRAELSKRMQEITREQMAMQGQMTALDKVIALYDPDYLPEKAEEPSRRRGRPRNEGQVTSREINALLSNVNKRRAVLEILRDAGRPLSTAECAAKFASRLGLEDNDHRLGQIANRLSAALDSLAKGKRVRHAGMVDGRRVLWEIAA
ncbi:hypothetical protein [Allomesorhizobium camelthorni]|uniref:Uncharacterized protein n=1 Tax=Allomesorhizobium camelthorni TaxID=475069 RepID=A0A6G4WMV2_9HYPH|nr:hypothetical protein [Mesorhizobium camelthorni]NGO56091.1 hypothetical protein [Mesorhizobium camelthorni]